MELRLFYCAFYLLSLISQPASCQEKMDYYISNQGNDLNPGTSHFFPKKTLSGLGSVLKDVSNATGPTKVGLKRGDIFEESLATSYPVHLNAYSINPGEKAFVVFNGSKEFNTGWKKVTGAHNTYQQSIPYSGFTGYGINNIGSYSFIYVIEIDKKLEKVAPISARKPLQFVTGQAAVEKTIGSFCIPVNTNENPMPVFVHTSDGSSPNENKTYRYEVVVRDWAVNSTYQPNNYFENLWVRGFGAGIGMLPGGNGSYYNKILFGPGAGIHHLVLRSGTIDHSVFFPGPKNTNTYGVVFYDREGMGRHGIIRNTMFLDIRLPIYSHTSEGSNFGAIELTDVVGFADSTETGGFITTKNNDSVIMHRVYTDNYISGHDYGDAKYVSINNSWFKGVQHGIAIGCKSPMTSLITNCFIKTKGIPYTYNAGIMLQDSTALHLTNSIIHITNPNTAAASRPISFLLGGGTQSNKIEAFGNIFIADVETSNSVSAFVINRQNQNLPSSFSLNNNVYVLLKGGNINWTISNSITGGGNFKTNNFETWKRQSAQDSNSLFFDLRNDPRGLKAIFADPENGNYELSNTREGQEIAALHAGMTTPLPCFLKKPSYEEAAEMVRNDMVLSVNYCRNPCLQNKVVVNATFDIAEAENGKVALRWSNSEQHNIDHYEIQRSSGLSTFNTIASQPVVRDAHYSFFDYVQPGIKYLYRLAIIAKSGDRCFTDIRTLNMSTNKGFTIYPNPAVGTIQVLINDNAGLAELSVMDSFGNLIMSKNVLHINSVPLKLNLTNISSGIYFLTIKTNKGVSTQKFIIR